MALALLFALLGSAGAVAAGSAILLFRGRASPLLPALVSYATGTLLAASLLAMLPSALERESDSVVLGLLLGGVVLFFVLERLMIWRHRHPGGHHVRGDASRELILLGDAVHNLMDGFAIGAAFAEGGSLGVSTAMAVIVHEVAQEAGDFAILLDGGLSRGRALVYNTLSSLTTIPAAMVAYVSASSVEQVIPVALAIAAASFLYIALADLVPRHHAEGTIRELPMELALIGLGIGTIGGLSLLS